MPARIRSSGAIFALSRPLTHRRGTQRLDAGWSIAGCGGSSILSSIGGNVAVARRIGRIGHPPETNIRQPKGTYVTFLSAVRGVSAHFSDAAFAYFYRLTVPRGAPRIGFIGTGARTNSFDRRGYFLRPRCAPLSGFPLNFGVLGRSRRSFSTCVFRARLICNGCPATRTFCSCRNTSLGMPAGRSTKL